jgi:UDP-N-acetylmuramoyl-L-alanyl-D-glutamate--2,6-diaminopimelate ligase
MHLSSLIASSDGLTLHGKDVDITGLAADSREVKPGYLFVAIPGVRHDGRTYIDEALRYGAVAVLAPEGTSITPQAAFVTTPEIRRTVSQIAARFYPRQPEIVAAVTGTSGKTSTAQFARELWQALGYKSASIGTLGLVTAEEARYGSLTTPDAITLHKLLEETAHNGITRLAVEASSHGLALHRLDDVRVKIGGFTNLSHDHLDFHETMENYLAVKVRLFSEVMGHGGVAVLNADTPEFAQLVAISRARGHRIIGYGRKGDEIRIKEIVPQAKGQLLRFELFGKPKETILPVIGAFQAWNALCALSMVIGSGADADKAADALCKLTGVPGRLQLVGTTKNGGSIFVDYAHKPDALENVLAGLRPHVAAHPGAKLSVVFGCGGNRDAGKRPIMGAVAQKLADRVIVTDDNPRHEDPVAIRREILKGCTPGPELIEIGDRAQAIATAIGHMGPNDVLIIAGKGHEPGQIVGDKVLAFDDAEVARKVLGT